MTVQGDTVRHLGAKIRIASIASYAGTGDQPMGWLDPLTLHCFLRRYICHSVRRSQSSRECTDPVIQIGEKSNEEHIETLSCARAPFLSESW